MWRLEPPAASGRGSVGHAPEPEDGSASHRGHGRAAQLTHARQPHHGPRREVVVFEDGEKGEQEPRAGQHPAAASLALLFTSYFVHTLGMQYLSEIFRSLCGKNCVSHDIFGAMAIRRLFIVVAEAPVGSQAPVSVT